MPMHAAVLLACYMASVRVGSTAETWNVQQGDGVLSRGAHAVGMGPHLQDQSQTMIQAYEVLVSQSMYLNMQHAHTQATIQAHMLISWLGCVWNSR